MKNRKAITDFIVSNIDKILPDGFNKKRTQEFLDSMNDKDFEVYIRKLGTEEERLSLIAPNGAKVKLDLKRNIELAKELNIKIFQRIWMKTPDGKGTYLSHDEYPILLLPIRRQVQLLTKKISIPHDNRSVDTLTGQPAGKSKGSKISYPEVQMLASMGLNESLKEFMKWRGGDAKAFHAMNTLINRNGNMSMAAAEPFAGRVKSTETLSSYLTGMHLINNL